MGDELSTDEFTDHDGKVGGNSVHSSFKIFTQRFSVFSEFSNLISEVDDELLIGFSDFRTHGDFSSLLNISSDFFSQEFRKLSNSFFTNSFSVLWGKKLIFEPQKVSFY